MNEQGLWELFFATGLPEVYLAVSQSQREDQARWKEPATTAFQANVKKV